MQAEAKAIVEYLKGWPKTFISGREISRKVGGRDRYEQDHGWAIHILAELVQKEILETDAMGYFRISTKLDEKRKNRFKRHVAPQILRILKTSGQSFEGFVLDEDEDEDDLLK